jgi:hypothetical protein
MNLIYGMCSSVLGSGVIYLDTGTVYKYCTENRLLHRNMVLWGLAPYMAAAASLTRPFLILSVNMGMFIYILSLPTLVLC